MTSAEPFVTKGSLVMQSLSAISRPVWLSAVALLAGTIALGLAAIPPIVFDRPFGMAPIEQPAAQPRGERQGGVNFKFGKLEVNVGGKVQPPPPPIPAPNPVKWFLLSAIAFALPTIVVGAIAWHRERHPALAGTGMALGVLAVAWQYIIIGIAVGVAVVIILVLLSALS
jgi:hypothetical protein